MAGLARIQDIQELLHFLIASLVKPDDVLLDATAGRGRDTLFLARCVPKGHVYAFDIQEDAIAQTRELLKREGLEDKVILYQMDHALMDQVVKEKVGAVVFNLGYLPGSNHAIKTRVESTIPALKSALALLRVNGVLVLTVYRGHPGAGEEAKQVQIFLSHLPKEDYSVLSGQYVNQNMTAPYWLMVQKKRGESWL